MDIKLIRWVGSSHRDLKTMPHPVRRVFGYGLYLAQIGRRDHRTKTLSGFGSASVAEMSERDADGTYRVVYTARFANAVYVLHCFQKKSKTGIATPKAEMDLVRARLREAEAHAKGK